MLRSGDPPSVLSVGERLGGKVSKYVAVVWCTECLGEDLQGCFDGKTHTLEDRKFKALEFDTPEEAESAGRDYIGAYPDWKWRVDEVSEEIKEDDNEA